MAPGDEPGSAGAGSPKPTFLSRARLITHLIRDLGLILGIPALIVIGVNLYELQIKALERQASAADAQAKAAEAQVKIAEHELEAVKESSSAQLKIASQQYDAVTAQIKATESENTVLKETQFDRAFALIDNQKKIYEADRQVFQAQFDKMNKTFKCEREVLKRYFDTIAYLDKLWVGPLHPLAPAALPVPTLPAELDKICLYDEKDSSSH